jgi:polyisoprenoid-binding protein YceI
MSRISLALAAACLVSAPALADQWIIDPNHSDAEFHVKHMMVSTVDGTLGTVSGTVVLDDKKPANDTVEATIDVTQLDTRVDKRNAHLKSPDFFDVAKFPTATFKSTKVTRKGKGKLSVTGELTMHGVTKPVTLAVTGPSPVYKNPWGQPVRAFWATTKLNREDYGLTWNKALDQPGAWLVGKDVDVTISVEVNPPKAEAPEAAAAPAAQPPAQPAAAAPAAK